MYPVPSATLWNVSLGSPQASATRIPETFFLDELVPKPFPSVDWLSRRLVAGQIPGSKVGRKWVMTAHDVSTALDMLKNPKARETGTGLSAGSAARRRSA